MGHIYTNPFEGDKPQVIKSETPIAELDGEARWIHTEGDIKATAAERKAAKEAADQTSATDAAADRAEQERIAALPIHGGDTVKLNEAALALVLESPDATPDALDKATAWRGVVTGIVREDDTDVVSFEDDTPSAPIDELELVTA